MSGRWILLAPDGRFTIIGRHPFPALLARAEADTLAAGITGWVAIMSGSLHGDTQPTVAEVRRVGEPDGDFRDAAAAMLARRDLLATTAR